MPELLLELLSEEIPARMQARAADDLKRLFTEGLKKSNLSFERAEAYATPRRLALIVDGIPAKAPDFKEERKGPRVGAPDQAIQGFLKSVGLNSLDQCEKREVKGNEHWFVVNLIAGQETMGAIQLIIEDCINLLSWPKSMRWNGTTIRWVRPLRSILCVFDGNCPEIEIDLVRTPEQATTADPVVMIKGDKNTVGHRFLGPDLIEVTDFADYKAKLEEAYVILDPADRRAKIKKGAEALAKKAGFVLRDDPALLDEVTGLVEWPVVLMGAIDDAYMDVPPEVLVTAMRHHQKYFALEDEAGKLAPKFIVVANIETADKGKAIVAGNERVLRARLADAKFFWDQDRKHTLASRAVALQEIVFHARLGTLDQKIDRVQALATAIAEQVPGADRDKVRSAARLAKADLSTGMVGEFPELQGIMGRYYALSDGESAEVADAIAEHYAPRGPGDSCPSAPVSVALALADRLDTLVGFWAIDEKPTGSRDPYGLRRAALGIIRLVIENNLRLPLAPLMNGGAEMLLNQRLTESVLEKRAILDDLGLDDQLAVETLEVEVEDDTPFGEVYAIVPELLTFFADRLKVYLREQGVRHDHVDAVFALGGEDDIVRLLARVEALAGFLDSEDGANLLIAYRRAANIVRIEEKKDKASYAGAPDPSVLEEAEEKALFKALGTAANAAGAAIEQEKYKHAMAALARLREPVDTFFDEVTVNAEDGKLRANRLRLLSSIKATMDKVADFSKIEGG
ncbi:MAG: glycine--tRNA ligase subunit beta [Alphaproteobacteria bacterium]|nr:glycine--tRNA ligase subunit beta [Alphaproteobacteria bacterium]